ncbi:neutral/alkaline nonlysosomal ceramidase [Grosmannia clavigera kw1407]|uniref:Neutral ceramidase n=1 Tax=Grosmannia clavigera (strain kw1407 / UAMH 11150) TaxID=655863 RepID=F0X9I0_GROCL|nr:neutral/alkaline nonlysosomal ceramidase [Grosmannia clavigera kw1407]EFX06050.1 neutral/alkaline nonlysosomal ceramidase [Grosmannia clavigera kw1407]
MSGPQYAYAMMHLAGGRDAGKQRRHQAPNPRRAAFTALAAAALFALVFFSVCKLGKPASSASSPRGASSAADLPLSSSPFSDANLGPPLLSRSVPAGDKYLIGVGKADITGPVVEVNLGGYASLSQIGSGLRQRVYARAFIVGDVSTPSDRIVYLVIDTQSGDTAVRLGILEGLAALGTDYSMYGASNVAVTGTHQHSGPGAWFNYLLPQITSLGFSKQSYQAIVDGSVLAIQRAHESLTTGYLDVGKTNITDGNLSRSLYSYMANPAAERAKYSTTTDTEMTLLRFQRASDLKNIGVLSWYPVHGTSMLENNTHVTGDNKGVASYLFEKAMLDDADAAEGFCCPAFSQANMCSYKNSTCADGKSESCHGRGPEFQKLDLGVSSCYVIGKKQSDGAKTIYDSLATSSTPIVGTTVKSFHFYQNMSYFQFELPNGTEVQTCPASLGYSFAAGTTDGPGAFDFTQADSGSSTANPLWSVVSGALRTPTAAQKACQYPKPILLDVGEMDEPYAWTPNIVDMQSMRIGQLIIIVSASEATTMSGRRWREAVHKQAASTILKDGADPVVVLGAPANVYAHYCATPEEYSIQRYEGASTLYGQWELPAYINLTLRNLHYLAADATGSPDAGPSPPDNRETSLSFITSVVFDAAPSGKSFGECIDQPKSSYAKGDVINATFVGANPRNNLRLEDTFAAVEKHDSSSGNWTQVRSDEDWSLVYTWERTSTVLGYSQVVLSWESEATAASGTYRLKYYGDSKPLVGSISAFTGISNSFTLS